MAPVSAEATRTCATSTAELGAETKVGISEVRIGDAELGAYAEAEFPVRMIDRSAKRLE